MKRYILACLTVAVVFGCWVSSGQPYEPYATYQRWTFNTEQNPLPPDGGFYNPNGTPIGTINNALYGGGVWDLWSSGPGSAVFDIPNYQYGIFLHKEVWIEVTWQPVRSILFVSVDGASETWRSSTPLGGNWMRSFYEFVFPDFNPASEIVRIGGAINLDEVVIHTIPEPSSLALLAVGAAALLVFRRRK